MNRLQWTDIESAAKQGYGDGHAPRIKALAEFINENMPEFRANVSPCSEQNSFKPKGLRYTTRTYKRREGYHLEVYEKRESFPAGIVRPVFSHKTTETYRRNSEVCRWMIENRRTA